MYTIKNKDLFNQATEAEFEELLSAYLSRDKKTFEQLLYKGVSVNKKFDWQGVLKTFKLNPKEQKVTGTLRELIELVNDTEYLALINSEKYLKIMAEKDWLYRLDIDLPVG